MRGEGRLVLAHQYMSNAAKQTARRLSFSINNMPFALHCFVLRRFGVIAPSIHDFMIWISCLAKSSGDEKVKSITAETQNRQQNLMVIGLITYCLFHRVNPPFS